MNAKANLFITSLVLAVLAVLLVAVAFLEFPCGQGEVFHKWSVS